MALPLTLALALAGSAGCSVGVPDPAAPRDIQTTPPLATPTITPGHDAAAVAAKDLPFTAGDSLAAGIAVGLSDGLREAPGVEAGQGERGGGKPLPQSRRLRGVGPRAR